VVAQHAQHAGQQAGVAVQVHPQRLDRVERVGAHRRRRRRGRRAVGLRAGAARRAALPAVDGVEVGLQPRRPQRALGEQRVVQRVDARRGEAVERGAHAGVGGGRDA
jgi:hypothetical protein